MAIMAMLAAGAVADYTVSAPSSISICANSNSSTSPQVATLQTCAKAAVVGNGFGSAMAFAKSQAKTIKLASASCGDAVANGVSDLCNGADPMTTIYAMSQTCAAALAEVYTLSVSGAEVTDGTPFSSIFNTAAKSKSADSYILACGDACGNAQACSQAFAQAAACGISSATDGCSAAGSYVSSKTYSKAFVKAITSSWSSACAKGLGKAQSQGEIVASISAQSIAKAFSQAAATACTSCPTCQCKALPEKFTWNDVSNFADASATATAGKILIANAMAKAVTTYCDSTGTPEALQASAQGAVDTLADLMISVVAKVSGQAMSIGNAWACGGGSLQANIDAVKQAYSEAVSDASAAIFGDWCPGAEAKLTQLGVMNSEEVQIVVNKALQACSKGADSKMVNAVILQQIKGNKPWVSAMSNALTNAQACGCKPASCAWCASGYSKRK